MATSSQSRGDELAKSWRRVLKVVTTSWQSRGDELAKSWRRVGGVVGSYNGRAARSRGVWRVALGATGEPPVVPPPVVASRDISRIGTPLAGIGKI